MRIHRLLLALAGAALLPAACMPGIEIPPEAPAPASGPAPAPAVDRRLGSPTVVRSVPQNTPQGVRGILDATLEVVYDTLQVPIDTARSGVQRLRAYRLVSARMTPYSSDSTVFDTTAFPGPTFEVSPGDSVRIRLVNSLPPSAPNDRCQAYPASSDTVPQPDTMQGCFHGPNYTNIHYHGFHVTPDSTGDDILLQIAPGTSYQYAFGIPWNQSPGTHWYHPHKHGSVALQVINGMSGAFIVRGGGLDSLTASLRMRDQLIAIQTVDSTVNLLIGGTKRVVLVNGKYRPVIQMYPNEVMRWRIVNENVNSTAQFQIGFTSDQPGFDAPAVFEVARDGVQFSPANYDTIPDRQVLMAPGNRLDVFVRAPRTVGIHQLRAQPIAAQDPARANQLDSLRLRAGGFAPADTLFTVEVIPGPPQSSTLPTALPALPNFLANLPGPIDSASLLRDTAAMPVIVFLDEDFGTQTRSRPTQFYLGTGPNPEMRFNDTVVYHPTTSTSQVRPMLLDSVQTWRVENHGIATNHPFHIHINPFQVLYVHAPNTTDPNQALYARLNSAAQRDGAPIWMDVVPLPLPANTANPTADPGYVIIRQRYDDFAGQYVMHCHILGHEERGMMQLLQVFRTPAEVTNRAEGHGHHH
jgi:FtsP/CotA-like multicopper oxidase with cupredoxin domain